jgi:hypothetical protein
MRGAPTKGPRKTLEPLSPLERRAALWGLSKEGVGIKHVSVGVSIPDAAPVPFRRIASPANVAVLSVSL